MTHNGDQLIDHSMIIDVGSLSAVSLAIYDQLNGQFNGVTFVNYYFICLLT